MPKYEVFAHETAYESCIVEANSEAEAIRIAENNCQRWEVYEGEDFEIECAELYGEEE